MSDIWYAFGNFLNLWAIPLKNLSGLMKKSFQLSVIFTLYILCGIMITLSKLLPRYSLRQKATPRQPAIFSFFCSVETRPIKDSSQFTEKLPFSLSRFLYRSCVCVLSYKAVKEEELNFRYFPCIVYMIYLYLSSILKRSLKSLPGKEARQKPSSTTIFV